VLWDIDSQQLATTVADVARVATKPPRGYRCDVGDRDMIIEKARQIVAEAGGVDFLINNAGVMSGRQLLDCSDEPRRRGRGTARRRADEHPSPAQSAHAERAQGNDASSKGGRREKSSHTWSCSGEGGEETHGPTPCNRDALANARQRRAE